MNILHQQQHPQNQGRLLLHRRQYCYVPSYQLTLIKSRKNSLEIQFFQKDNRDEHLASEAASSKLACIFDNILFNSKEEPVAY